MIEYYRGIKAGILAGIVYAINDSAIFVVAGPTLLNISSASWTLTMLLFLENLIVGGVIGGIVSGLIYAALYNDLPAKSLTAKGIIVGIVFWLIFGVALNITYLTTVSFLVESFVAKAIVFGALLGNLWKIFGTRMQQSRTN